MVQIYIWKKEVQPWESDWSERLILKLNAVLSLLKFDKEYNPADKSAIVSLAKGSAPKLSILWCFIPSGVKSTICIPPSDPSTINSSPWKKKESYIRSNNNERNNDQVEINNKMFFTYLFGFKSTHMF